MCNAAELLDEQEIIQQALDNFAALVEDADYGLIMDSMGLGRLQFMRRKQMRVELAGLYMALWRLALAHSFPGHADAMFTVFLENFSQNHSGKLAVQITERARQYWEMILPKGDSDFIAVARHLTSFVVKEDQDLKPLTLKLALQIRQTYRFIFERLI